MAFKELSRVDIAEVIRRWQKGISLRRTASGAGLSRDTVRKYVTAAGEEGVSQKGPAPTEEQLSRPSAAPARPWQPRLPTFYLPHGPARSASGSPESGCS